MLFQTKPILYLQLLHRSLRYMLVHPTKKTLIEQNEIVFETDVLVDGNITNQALLETRLDVLVKEKKLKRAQTYILLPNDFVTVREEVIPGQLAADEIDDYLKLHMNQSIRMPFENPIFQYTILSDSAGTEVIPDKHLLLLAYPGGLVEQYKDILEKVSLKPEVADVTALSLYRVLSENSSDNIHSEQHIMLLQWNPVDVSIMVFHEDRPMFNRHTQNDGVYSSWNINANAEWQWTETEVDLQMSIEEQLNSLERFLDFYQYSVLKGDVSISQIILTGDYPDLNALKERINERFPVEVQLLKLPTGIEQPFAALYGLTLRNDTKTKNSKVKRGKK